MIAAMGELLQHLLLERPWPAALTLVIVAAILFSVGAQRRQGKWQLAAAGLVALAGGVVTLAWAVTTDRERVIAATASLLAATEAEAEPDDPALDRLLHRGVVLTGPGGEIWLEDDALRTALGRALSRYGPVSHDVRQQRVEVDAPRARARVELELRTELGAGEAGFPVRSSWTLLWVESPRGWVLEQIAWRELQQRPPQQGWLP